jgi:hypothetical protein
MDERTDALPKGTDYFDLVFRLEAECEAATATFLPKAGEKAPMTWIRLGTNLAVLEALSCCWWGCRGGDHVVEYLLGRTVGSVRAAVRLARAGLYDESFNALRTAGEVVNLLTLFSIDGELLEVWRATSPRDRFALARPTNVMRRLAEAGRAGSSLNFEKYDLLSRIAHGNTSDAPQAHNPLGLPLAAGLFQNAGFLVALNEAALAVALAILAGVKLIDLDTGLTHELLGDARELVEATGAVTLTTVGEALGTLREQVVRDLREAAEE